MNSFRSGIYLIVNEYSGKFYIGSARDLERRRGEHFRSLVRGQHYNKPLQRAWNKYGESVFKFRILLYCNKSNLLFFEQRTLDTYKAHYGWRNLYNTCPFAGSAMGREVSKKTRAKISASNTGKTHSQETLKKLSMAKLGVKRSDAARERIRVTSTGRWHTEEAKAKISQTKMGHPVSEETKRKIGAIHKGSKRSDETKKKMSSSGMGRKVSEETREKLRQINKGRGLGRKLSEETRKKMSESRKGKKINRRAKTN